jgi:SpoVK/Ycf46/Vps4 family AAA+-type ATPase
MTALRDDLKAKEVKMKNFTDAIEALNPTMNDEMKMAYEKILMRFKKTAGSGVSKDDLKYMR